MNNQKALEETTERKEMEEKVALLEQQLKLERDKSGSNANTMLLQQKDLEEKLKSQILATEKLLKKQERERQERSMLIGSCCTPCHWFTRRTEYPKVSGGGGGGDE